MLNLPSEMPAHASQLYARNVMALLQHLAPDGKLNLDWDDEITAGACVTREKVAAMSQSQFMIELTILVLAIFVGIEVISKVPTLLHTPLMSGTNAIHGIVIVGAIIVAGLPDQVWWVRVVARRGGTRDDERGRRLRRHRPDARDVQEARAGEGGAERVSRTDAITLAYLVTIICFILALRFLSSPARARQGNWVGAFGMAVAIVATFFRPGSRTSAGSCS